MVPALVVLVSLVTTAAPAPRKLLVSSAIVSRPAEAVHLRCPVHQTELAACLSAPTKLVAVMVAEAFAALAPHPLHRVLLLEVVFATRLSAAPTTRIVVPSRAVHLVALAAPFQIARAIAPQRPQPRAFAIRPVHALVCSVVHLHAVPVVEAVLHLPLAKTANAFALQTARESTAATPIAPTSFAKTVSW